jgi:hypothetical protein
MTEGSKPKPLPNQWIVYVDDVNGKRFAFAAPAGEKNGQGVLDLFDRLGRNLGWTYELNVRDATPEERAKWLETR